MNKYERYKKVDLPWLEEVPEHWEIISVKKQFNITRGIVIPKTELTETGLYPVYSSQTKNKGILGYRDEYELDKESITWTTDGANAGTVFYREGKYSCTNICGILISREEINSLQYKFKAYVLGVAAFYHKRKDTNGYKIMSNEMKNILIPIPPVAEQEQIAAYLDWKINEIDRLIAVEEEKILELQRLLSTKIDRIFDELIKISPSKIRMRFLYEFQNGISTSKDYTNGEFPFLTYSDVYNNLIVPEKLGGRINSDRMEQEIYSIAEGDLFVTRTSERIEDAGKVSLALHNVENAVFNGFTIRLRSKSSNNFLAKFILHYLNSEIVREKIISSLNLVTRVSIKQEILKEVSVPVVSIKDQRHTVEFIEELSNTVQSEIVSVQSKINYFKSLKNSLISEVVTGKIDVRNVTIPSYEKVDVSVSTNEEEIEE